MKEENAIEVKNITKTFKVYLDKGSTLKEKILFSKRRKYEERKVLDGISFDVKKGEAIGLIGHNGCGKSTTLKLLTRIMYPDSGIIDMKGRVSSLIELGAGFHPDMSGRENIYINASIFGLTRKEIDKRLDDIIAFSELEEFIDNPVRTYSSGMYMRLAFSVAINVDADILLIDEILAVGDTNFQAKCFNRLREVKSEGTTIVIVSHSLGQIEQICERSIWINDGKIMADGVPRDVHPQYLDYMGHEREEIAVKEAERQRKKENQANREKSENINFNNSTSKPNDSHHHDKGIQKEIGEISTQKKKDENKTRWGNGDARIIEIHSYNISGEEKLSFKTGEEITFEISFSVKKKIEDATLGIAIFRGDGVHCYGTNTKVEKFDKFDIIKDGKFYVILKNTELLPSTYLFDFAIESGNGIPIDYYTKAYKIDIYSDISDIGIFRPTHELKVVF